MIVETRVEVDKHKLSAYAQIYYERVSNYAIEETIDHAIRVEVVEQLKENPAFKAAIRDLATERIMDLLKK